MSESIDVTRRQQASSHRPAWAISLAVGLLITGCDVPTMAFLQDERVRIVEPPDRGSMDLPVTLRWDVREFDVTGRDGQSLPSAGYFAVFVDRTPIPPGKTLEWYVLQDGSCGDHPCATVDNLADVYTTEETSLKLATLPALRERDDVELHQVVIVLLDGTGKRIGESAFYVRFNFERGA